MTARRRRRFSRLNTFYFFVTLGLMVGGSLWLDYRSPTVLATVSGKHEEIQYSFAPQGSWYRFYRVGVDFSNSDSRLGAATIQVPEQRYDALQPGDTLSIRYLAALPMFARSADRSTVSVVRELGARMVSDQVLAPLLIWIAAGLIMLWLASRVATPAIVVGGLIWIAAGFPLLLPAPPVVPAPPSETLGRVVGISLVDRAPERRAVHGRRHAFRGSGIRRLKVPYQVVQFRVAVPGQSDSVLAVDAVDSGSTPGLAFGALLPARYDPASPRDARLSQGTRSFMMRNRYHFRVPVVGVGLLGMLGAWGWRTRRMRRGLAA